VLHRRGAIVSVYDCFDSGFHRRGGALGAVDVDLVKDIRGDNRGAGHTGISGHGHFYGDLWKFLADGLPQGSISYGKDLIEIEHLDSNSPNLIFLGEEDNHSNKYDLIVGADGGKSTVRKYVTDKLPFYSGYTVWRGLCPTEGVDGPPRGSESVNGVYYETLGFPTAGPDKGVTLWNCGIYMNMPEHMVSAPVRNRQIGGHRVTIEPWFLPFVTELFGERNAKFWKDCTDKGKVTPHPVWEFATDKAVRGRVLLLGDAAHMASPRTGAGAHTAFVDAAVLGSAFEKSKTIEEALGMYNESVVERGMALHKRSLDCAKHFAPKGKGGIAPEDVMKMLLANKG